MENIQLLILYTLIRLVPTCTGSLAGEVLIIADNDWPSSSWTAPSASRVQIQWHRESQLAESVLEKIVSIPLPSPPSFSPIG